MKEYHGTHKDHHYWDHVKWDAEYVTKQEREAAKATKPAPIKNPTYKTTKVREADGSTTYYDGQVRKEPIRINGIMI